MSNCSKWYDDLVGVGFNRHIARAITEAISDNSIINTLSLFNSLRMWDVSETASTAIADVIFDIFHSALTINRFDSTNTLFKSGIPKNHVNVLLDCVFEAGDLMKKNKFLPCEKSRRLGE